jgi:hypothetical protein
LKVLQETIGKNLLIIWDRLQVHRSKLVRTRRGTERANHDRLPAGLRAGYEPRGVHLGRYRHESIAGVSIGLALLSGSVTGACLFNNLGSVLFTKVCNLAQILS